MGILVSSIYAGRIWKNSAWFGYKAGNQITAADPSKQLTEEGMNYLSSWTELEIFLRNENKITLRFLSNDFACNFESFLVS